MGKAGEDLKLLDCTDYKLVATLDHQGSSISSGHWVSKLRTESGQWVLCSDDHVRETDTAVSENNYILLFKKESSVNEYPDFIPSFEWQELQPWQSVPRGCWVRMALDGSGMRMAKLQGDSETEKAC